MACVVRSESLCFLKVHGVREAKCGINTAIYAKWLSLHLAFDVAFFSPTFDLPVLDLWGARPIRFLISGHSGHLNDLSSRGEETGLFSLSIEPSNDPG